MNAGLAFVAGVALGAGLVALGVTLERAGHPRPAAAAATPARPTEPVVSGSTAVADNAPLQPVAVHDVRVPFRFSGCTRELVRNQQGTFIGEGRYLRPDEVLRKGRYKVAVVEAWYCKPCKRVVHALARMDLGVNVDLIVLGTGDAPAGNHMKVVDALTGGTGWLYIEGFDAEHLLEAVFGEGHYATPSVLLLDGDDTVVAGIQTSDEHEITRWLATELTAVRHVASGRDQPLASLDPTHDAEAECFRPEVRTSGGGGGGAGGGAGGGGAGSEDDDGEDEDGVAEVPPDGDEPPGDAIMNPFATEPSPPPSPRKPPRPTRPPATRPKQQGNPGKGSPARPGRASGGKTDGSAHGSRKRS